MTASVGMPQLPTLENPRVLGRKALDLPCYRLHVDLEKVAAGLQIGATDASQAFQDGRVSARFVELHTERLYELLPPTNSCQKGWDGLVKMDGRLVKTCVRCLTRKGIRFQQSGFMGKGRTCTREDLLASIEEVEVYLLADITGFPEVLFLPVPAWRLADLARAGTLTASGFDRRQVYLHLFGATPANLAFEDAPVPTS